jgi:hypothetical protein
MRLALLFAALCAASPLVVRIEDAAGDERSKSRHEYHLRVQSTDKYAPVSLNHISGTSIRYFVVERESAA